MSYTGTNNTPRPHPDEVGILKHFHTPRLLFHGGKRITFLTFPPILRSTRRTLGTICRMGNLHPKIQLQHACNESRSDAKLTGGKRTAICCTGMSEEPPCRSTKKPWLCSERHGVANARSKIRQAESSVCNGSCAHRAKGKKKEANIPDYYSHVGLQKERKNAAVWKEKERDKERGHHARICLCPMPRDKRQGETDTWPRWWDVPVCFLNMPTLPRFALLVCSKLESRDSDNACGVACACTTRALQQQA